MKKLITISFLFLFNIINQTLFSQTQTDSLKTYVITRNDGSEIVARVISQDMREMVLETKTMGRFILPKYEVKSIRELNPGETNENGDLKPTEIFNTRYFITTNGLPIKKGDSYMLWNLYGPDFQFGLGKNFGMGVTTTWVGFPIIATAKYSISFDENVHLGFGTLLGSGTYLAPQWYMALPFGALTFGDKNININFSSGYGYVSNKGSGSGRTLASMAAMFKVSKTVSIVFDSFFMLKGPTTTETISNTVVDPNTGKQTTFTNEIVKNRPGMGIIIPGIRFQTDKNRAFQFGFAGFNFDNTWARLPIPMVQWFRAF